MPGDLARGESRSPGPGTAGCRGARGHASPDQAVPVPGHRRRPHQASSGLYLKVIKTNREALDVTLPWEMLASEHGSADGRRWSWAASDLIHDRADRLGEAHESDAAIVPHPGRRR